MRGGQRGCANKALASPGSQGRRGRPGGQGSTGAGQLAVVSDLGLNWALLLSADGDEHSRRTERAICETRPRRPRTRETTPAPTHMPIAPARPARAATREHTQMTRRHTAEGHRQLISLETRYL